MAVTISVEPDAVSNVSAWTVTSDKDDATAKTITVFADYTGTVAGTVKVTTSTSHTYLTNDVAVITSTTNYNGTYDLTKIDTNEFYITVTWVADDATGTVTLTNSNFRIKAELIISAATVAVKWQPAGTLSWDFKRILWELITYTAIDFDSLNIITTNTDSYKSYTIKFTEYWENTSNALVTGANDTSDAKVIYKVDCTTFADYNLSADDEEFLTGRPITNKIKIGNNLITSWSNWGGVSGFDTFTTSGRNITSAIDSSGANFGLCLSSSFGNIKKGDVIEFYCNFTKNSGTFPIFYLIEGDGTSAVSNVGIFAEGYNYKALIATVDIAIARVIIRSEQASLVNFSMIQVYVSKGYNELDYLGFISEEADIIAEYIQYDIDGSAIDSKQLATVALSGDRGIMPISALLFAHNTTQIESILFKVTTPEVVVFTSEGITFVRDPVCWNNPIRIEWLNKFGAFDAYTFLDNYNEGRSGKRSTYKNTSDVEQILDIENYQTIETFSNYETKTNIDWIKTILDSKKVYWIVDNVRIEVVVTGLSQVKKKKERVKLALSFRKLI